MRTLLDPTLDVVFKLLLTTGPESHQVLCGLLSSVLQKPITAATVLNPEITSRWVKDKSVVLDVLCQLPDGTRVDIEMQRDRRTGFEDRSLYYWTRAYSAPMERGEPYHKLVPVISVLFLNYVELSWSRLHSLFHVLEVHVHKRYWRSLEAHMIELPKLHGIRRAPRGERALVRWCRFLTARTEEQMEEVARMDPNIRAAKRALERLSADPKARELARQRQLARDTYRIEMTAAREEGREEGWREGKEEGRLAEARSALRRVLARRGLKLSPALSKRIERCNDLATLERWHDAAIVAKSAEEALA